MVKEEPAVAIFSGDVVIINDEPSSNRIFNKGCFGAIVDQKLHLSLVEALYLLEKKDIVIMNKRKKLIDFNEFVRLASKLDPRFLSRYFVYADIRKRGYIVKTALKYGADFRVYDRGEHPGKEHAKWILFAVKETEHFDWRKFAAMMRVAHSVKKRILLGILDDEGDVTYYEIRWRRP